ncbi:hypothetical protein RHSIM_Rhsim09G0108800 [Rhododendron simsii]|uniref:Uncharacterized protein n=1 Tax=Rhododendron simsii TaxID=118357 RepID=A0A834LF02_RHOSS|nr:hypothetical protein RHSIM_Rhsim09G0108800 [Rhododendron simsii]
MEVQKRKRRGVDGGADGRRTRVRKDDRVKMEEEPDDDEVEEFFAILRRIRVAVEYFEKGNGEGGRRGLAATEPLSRRSPCFERRDFEEADGVKRRGEEEEGDTGLDLNADPDSEPDLVGEHVVS